MSLSTLALKRYRKGFGWAFLTSLVILMSSNIVWLAAPQSISPKPHPPDVNIGSPTSPPSSEGGGGGGGGPGGGGKPSDSLPNATPSNPTDLSLYISAISLLTSMASFVGFFFTSLISWRKERREQRHSEVDLEKKTLELEKLRRELGPKPKRPNAAK
jgi:hypothetical protein